MNIIDLLGHNFLYLSAMIFGIIYIFTQYKIAQSNAAKQSNEILRGLLDDQTKEIDLLRNKLEQHQKLIKDNEMNFERVSAQNKMLQDIVQGRDPTAIKFQEEGFKAISLTAKIFENTTKTNENIEKLIELFEKHLSQLEKLLKRK